VNSNKKRAKKERERKAIDQGQIRNRSGRIKEKTEDKNKGKELTSAR